MQLTSRSHRTTEAHSDVEKHEKDALSPRSHVSHRSPLFGRKSTTARIADLNRAFRRQSHKKWIGDPRVLFERLLLRWSRLSYIGKFLVIGFAFVVFLSIWGQFFYRLGLVKPAKTSSSTESSFAVVINTYKRPDMLREAIQHYADTCGRSAGVSQVFVVWAEQDSVIPDSTSFFDDRIRRRNLDNRAVVEVLQKAKDSLNSRFEPISDLESTAVFMVDDDLRVACSSLIHAFEAWKTSPDSMAGFYPRLASPPRGSNPETSTELVYHTWPVVFWKQSFNLVLTKASFLHAKYLDLYTDDQKFPKAVKDHVDKHMNCEDIAMSMLVANYTKFTSGTAAPPIYVEGSVSDKGIIGGISSGAGHMTTRSECLTKLTAVLKGQGWPAPFDYEVSLEASAWVHHSPGFWWQHRPSHIFEWLALANTFI